MGRRMECWRDLIMIASNALGHKIGIKGEFGEPSISFNFNPTCPQFLVRLSPFTSQFLLRYSLVSSTSEMPIRHCLFSLLFLLFSPISFGTHSADVLLSVAKKDAEIILRALKREMPKERTELGKFVVEVLNKFDLMDNFQWMMKSKHSVDLRNKWEEICPEWKALQLAYRNWVTFTFYADSIQEGDNIKYLAVRPIVKRKAKKSSDENTHKKDEHQVVELIEMLKNFKKIWEHVRDPPEWENKLASKAVASYAEFCQIQAKNGQKSESMGKEFNAAKEHLKAIFASGKEVLAGKSTGFSAKNEKYNAIKHFPEPKNPFMALIECLIPK